MANVSFDADKMQQLVNSIINLKKAKNFDVAAAFSGALSSVADAVNKTLDAHGKSIINDAKINNALLPKDATKYPEYAPSGLMEAMTVVTGIAAGAKASQDILKVCSAYYTPSKGESDVTSKFMPSKDEDYEKIVELLTTKTNEDILTAGKTLFCKIKTSKRDFDAAYNAIMTEGKVSGADMDAVDPIKKAYDPSAQKATEASGKFNTNKDIYLNDKKTKEEKATAMIEINTAYKAGQKISIDIAGNLKDIKSIYDAIDDRTKGKALYVAAQKAFEAIANACALAGAKAAAEAAKAKADSAKTEAKKSPDEIAWKNAAGYYWKGYINASRNAMNDLKTANRTLENNPLAEAIKILQGVITANTKTPVQ